MDWSKDVIDGLDVALNEADVRAIRYDAATAEAELLVDVAALPETGPIDSDARRVIRMSGVTTLEFRLTRDDGSHGPVLPIASLDAVHEMFETAAWAYSMYGWAFVDIADPQAWCRAEPSGRSRSSSHGPLP